MQSSAPPVASHVYARRRRAWAWSLLRPRPAIAILLGVHVVLWGLLPAWFDAAAPTDNLEQLLWAQDLALAYLKHPPVPTWLLYGLQALVGSSIGLTFVAGALCSGAALCIVYWLGRRVANSSVALLATLLTSTLAYFSVKTFLYNHNTVQIPLAAATIAAFYLAVRHDRVRDWVALGAAAGLMMLTKYSAVVLFVAFAIYLVWSGRWREARTWRGIAIGTVVLAALMLPHLLAAAGSGAHEEGYAAQMIFPPEIGRLGRIESVWNFAGSQLGGLLPTVIAFLLVARGARKARATARPNPNERTFALEPFLVIVGFGPFVVTIVGALILNARLLSGWGTTLLILFALWLVTSRRFALLPTRRTVLRTFVVCVGLQVVLAALVIANHGRMPDLNLDRPGPLPAAPNTLGTTLQQLWLERTGKPLRTIVADRRTGGYLAVQSHGRVHVIDGDRGLQSWYTPELRERCGLLAITQRFVAVDAPAGQRAPDDPVFEQVDHIERIEVADAAPQSPRRAYWIGWQLPQSSAPCDISKR